MTATLGRASRGSGRMSWTDTVGGVLGSAIPDMRAEYRDVNFRHLCSHRSWPAGQYRDARSCALSRIESDDSRADRIAIATLGLQQAPSGPKETNFEYSNTGYVIAGAMLETKMGATWERSSKSTCSIRSAWPAPVTARQARRAPTISRWPHEGPNARNGVMGRNSAERWRSATTQPRSARQAACTRTSKTCSNI
jgi:hypothetical protein